MQLSMNTKTKPPSLSQGIRLLPDPIRRTEPEKLDQTVGREQEVSRRPSVEAYLGAALSDVNAMTDPFLR